MDRWGARLQFLYTPNSNVTNRTVIDHTESDERAIVSYSVQDPQDWTNNSAPRPITYTSRLARFGYSPTFNPFGSAGNDQQNPVRSRTTGVASTTDWKLDGGYTLTSISAWRNYYFNAVNDADYTYLPIYSNGYKTMGDQASQEN